MKTFKRMAAQGDMMIIRCEEIPDDCKRVDPVNGKHVLAHSETGHNHVIDAPKAELYQSADDEFIAYLKVITSGAVVEHQRDFDTHEPISIGEGTYQIRRQREYVAEGYRRAAD